MITRSQSLPDSKSYQEIYRQSRQDALIIQTNREPIINLTKESKSSIKGIVIRYILTSILVWCFLVGLEMLVDMVPLLSVFRPSMYINWILNRLMKLTMALGFISAFIGSLPIIIMTGDFQTFDRLLNTPLNLPVMPMLLNSNLSNWVMDKVGRRIFMCMIRIFNPIGQLCLMPLMAMFGYSMAYNRLERPDIILFGIALEITFGIALCLMYCIRR